MRSLAAVAAPDVAGGAAAAVLEVVPCAAEGTGGDLVRSGEEGDAGEGGREIIEGIMNSMPSEGSNPVGWPDSWE